MKWLLVFAASAAEIAGVIGLKKFSQYKTLPRLLGREQSRSEDTESGPPGDGWPALFQRG